MLKTKNLTVRSTLTIYLVPLVVVIFIGNQVYNGVKSIAALEKDLENLAEQVAQRLSTSLDKPLWDMDEKAVLATLDSEMKQRNITGIIVKTGQNNSSVLGRGRDDFWKVVEAKTIAERDTIFRQMEITHDDKPFGTVTVYCTHKFIDAERNSMIVTTVISSLVMAALVALAVFLLLSGILRREVSALSAEAKRIQVAVQEGRLSERADPASVGPEFRDVLKGMNLINEAFVPPLRRNMRFVQEMADGQVPARDENQAQGEFEEARQASNRLVDTVHMRNADADMLIQAALDGNLNVRADTLKYRGYNSKLVERMNEMIDAVAKPLGVAAKYVDLIAKGEIPERIREDWNGDFNSLRNSINQCIDALSGLLSGMTKMTKEHAAGEVDAAVDEKSFLGAYRNLAAGVNHGIRMYVDLLLNIQTILVAYADGNFEPVLQRLPGKQEQVNQTLDKLRGNLRSFSVEVQALSNNAVAGKLSARADVTRYAGDWRKLVEGVNATLDAVIAPLKVAGDTVDRIAKGDIPAKLTANWKGEFTVLEANLNTCIDSLNGLIAHMTTMTRAQTGGDYDAYMPEDRFVGVYRELAAGVNSGVRILVQTILKILKVLSAYADGDFNPVLEKLPGKQAIANEQLDLLRRNLLLVASEIRSLSEAAVQGRLSARVDPTKFKGDWASLAKGLNATLESILAPVHEASQSLERMAKRDLRVRIKGTYLGDHAVLAAAVNDTAQALHEAMVKVAESADQVSSASSQVASSSQAVASGASEQASAVEETSASLETMASMTRQSADNAHQANTLAQSARNAASEGTAVMKQMQGAMGKILASAESTSEIIKDINEIAFQTNLLALNAAVEAARAGEAGRGFAVVAEEVRSLALRSKEAANRTEALIRQSVKEAEEGGNTTEHVSETLSEITRSVAKVSDIVAEIAASAKEQASGIEQATRAVGEVDKITQQNAASSEESNSAAQELSSQADDLAAMVRTFELARDRSLPAKTGPGGKPLALPGAKGKAPAASATPRRQSQQASSGAEHKSRNPEDVIPLEHDRDFQDF